jgi:hypothetical protein
MNSGLTPMQSSNTPYVVRPRIAFRIGVTGAVSFEPAQLDRLRAQVADVLQKIHEEVLRCASTAAPQLVYQPGTTPLLRLVSPLADGADRLVAQEMLNRDRQVKAAKAPACDVQLEVALPFDQEAYEATFANDTPAHHAANIAEFATLLAAAQPRVLTLDGNSLNDIDRPRSYEAVGRLVVRNCDLLIAIWDDERPARGRGGTADTVHYALRGGVPVWWIHAAKDVPPKWLEDILDLPRFGVARSVGTDGLDELRGYIANTILPPGPADPGSQGVWDRVVTCLRCLLGLQPDPLLGFLAETGVPNRKMWNLHPIFIRALRRRGARLNARHAGRPAVAQHQPAAAPAPGAPRADGSPLPQPQARAGWMGRLTRCFTEPFRRSPPSTARTAAAGLSVMYRDCYRSSYTLVFVCGAIALISAVIGLVISAVEPAMVFVELVMLCGILGLVVANQLLRWHERYISYRMLAELERLSPHLQRLGWGLPGARVHNLAHSTRRHWVAWFFAATMRAQPLVAGHFGGTAVADMRCKILQDLIGDQLEFHARRRVECSGASQILGRWGRGFFLLTLAIVLARAVLLMTGSAHPVLLWLSPLSALLPAASAAFFGLRTYEEFEVLAQQSEQMHEALHRAAARIERIAVGKPLASQVLGTELFDVATIMLSDVAGWAQLFRLKAVDA